MLYQQHFFSSQHRKQQYFQNHKPAPLKSVL